jgi:hypothetical protein
MLRDLCHRCFVEGQNAVLEDFFGTCDSDAAELGDNELERCESSVNLENIAAEASEGEADMTDAPMEQPSQDHTNDGSTSSNNTSLISEVYPNTPRLQIGSNKRTWFDFGDGENNIVGSRHCLPIIISAPGSSESVEEDVDLALYFDVEISCGSNNDLGVSLEADCADDISLVGSSVQFTMKEGECQVVYIQWSPSCQGGLRQSIFVKTTFNGTSDLVAEDEIVAVASAIESAADIMITEVHEGAHYNYMQHEDLAQSTLDDKSSTDQMNDVEVADENEMPLTDEEHSQHDVEQNNSIEEKHDDAHAKSDRTELHPSNQTQNEQPQKKEASVNEKPAPVKNGSKEKSGAVKLSFHLKAGAKITSSTTHSNQQLHSSIQNKMAGMRAQRATTSYARDSRGRRVRQTHPSVAVNFAGLSNRAKLMRYQRIRMLEEANKQREAADESEKKNDPSLEENGKVEAAGQDALADDGEAAMFEEATIEEDAKYPTHEKEEHRRGVLLSSPLSETVEFKNIGEESEHRGAVLLQTPPNTQEPGGDSFNQPELPQHELISQKMNNPSATNELSNEKLSDEALDPPKQCCNRLIEVDSFCHTERTISPVGSQPKEAQETSSYDPTPETGDRLEANDKNEVSSTAITDSSDAEFRDDCVEHRFDSPVTKTMLQTMVNVSVEVDERKLTIAVPTTEAMEVQHAASADSLADEISDMKDYLTPRDQHLDSNESAVDVSMINASTDEPKIFTFVDNSPTRKSNQKGDENVNDEVWIEILITLIYYELEPLTSFVFLIYFQQMASPNALSLSNSYENTTNELDDLMDKVSVTAFVLAADLTQLTPVCFLGPTETNKTIQHASSRSS